MHISTTRRDERLHVTAKIGDQTIADRVFGYEQRAIEFQRSLEVGVRRGRKVFHHVLPTSTAWRVDIYMELAFGRLYLMYGDASRFAEAEALGREMAEAVNLAIKSVYEWSPEQ